MSIKAKGNLPSPKDSTPTHSRYNKNNVLKTQDHTSPNLLTKTCCPNCRYIFHVVTQNKLANFKEKLDQLTPIKEPGQKVSPLNYEKPDYHDYAQNKKASETPKFSPKHPEQELKSSANKFTTPAKKVEQRERQQKNEEEKQIKQDIKMMKKYLKAVSKQKKPQIKSHDISIDDQFYPNLNISQENAEINKSNIEGFSSIPINQIEIRRKCPHCHAGTVQVETALAAAKSKLLERELAAILPFVDESTITPSYVKCLKQMAQNS